MKEQPAGSATLNLERMDKVSFTPDNDGTILHEFGHAIGFQHEQQSPASVCKSEFDWDYLYKNMGWSRQKVDINMMQLEPSTRLSTTAFDPASVMLYNLDREFFRSDIINPTCYVPKRNNAISETDREAAAIIYPIAVSMRSLPRKRSLFAPPRDAAVTAAIKRLKELTDIR